MDRGPAAREHRDEWLRLFAINLEELLGGRFELTGAPMGAAPQLALYNQADPALNDVEPRGARRSKMQMDRGRANQRGMAGVSCVLRLSSTR